MEPSLPEEWLKAIIDTAKDAIIVLDRERRIRFANKAALLYGRKSGGTTVVDENYDDILGKNTILDEKGAEASRDTHPSVLVFKTGQPVREKLFQQVVGGISQWVEVSSFPLLGQDGSVEFVIVRFTDVSEKKDREDKLKFLVESKDAFIATLSHELRNPLAPIKSMLEVMKLESTSPGLRHNISVIEHQFDHLTKVLHDLLEVNRYARGKIHVELRRVNLLTVMRNSVESAEPFFKKKGLELHVSLPQHPIIIRADQTRLEQALMNVLHNSEKFTPTGGHVYLDVTTTEHTVSISIRDTGVGIDPEMLPLIFETGTREGMNRYKTEGLGLGLMLVKEIVQLHDGQIRAKSEGIGKGSEFIITLPILQQQLL